MNLKRIFFIIIFTLMIISFVSAGHIGINLIPDGTATTVSTTINISEAEYWKTDEGTLDNIIDILGSWIDNNLNWLNFTQISEHFYFKNETYSDDEIDSLIIANMSNLTDYIQLFNDTLLGDTNCSGEDCGSILYWANQSLLNETDLTLSINETTNIEVLYNGTASMIANLSISQSVVSGNPFDQSLNTTDDVEFENVTSENFHVNNRICLNPPGCTQFLCSNGTDIILSNNVTGLGC